MKEVLDLPLILRTSYRKRGGPAFQTLEYCMHKKLNMQGQHYSSYAMADCSCTFILNDKLRHLHPIQNQNKTKQKKKKKKKKEKLEGHIPRSKKLLVLLPYQLHDNSDKFHEF